MKLAEKQLKEMEKQGSIFYQWKGEGYWAYDIFNSKKEFICIVGWSHEKNRWILNDVDEDIEGLDKSELTDILSIFPKLKRIGN